MKRIKSILVCGLVMALTGVTTLLVAAGGSRDTKAVVRSVHGKVTYKSEGGDWLPLRVNQELKPSTELKSEAGAEAYLQVNGFTSTVKLQESTDITLAKMTAMGPGLSADSSTDLKLDGGTVLGSVRKLSATSDYKVSVPNGVAGIRGTDFAVTVTVLAGGNFEVVFRSVTGIVVCQVVAPPGGTQNPTSQTLQTGQSWTVTGTITGGVVQTVTIYLPVQTPPAIQVSLVTAITTIITTFTPPSVTPPVIVFVPPNNNPSSTGGNANGSDTTTTTDQ